MSEDIKVYYKHFHRLLNVDELEEIGNDDYIDSIFWRKDGEIILEYAKKYKRFYIKYNSIWEKFEEKYRLNYSDISELFSGMLEDVFKLRVDTTKRFI